MASKNIRVLIVDDDPKIRASLDRDFEEAGFDVMTAISAAEAKSILSQKSFDAILCDNQMTGMTGTSLLGNVSRDYPNMKRFMLSGDISATQAFLVEKEIGVCGLFEKPCSSNKLIASIVEAVS